MEIPIMSGILINEQVCCLQTFGTKIFSIVCLILIWTDRPEAILVKYHTLLYTQQAKSHRPLSCLTTQPNMGGSSPHTCH